MKTIKIEARIKFRITTLLISEYPVNNLINNTRKK